MVQSDLATFFQNMGASSRILETMYAGGMPPSVVVVDLPLLDGIDPE